MKFASLPQSVFGEKETLRLEQKSLAWREKIERRYVADPRHTRAELIYHGFWYIAAQLKADYEVGRL